LKPLQAADDSLSAACFYSEEVEVMFIRFLKNESGATAIEYGLIASLVFLGCVTAFFSFGDSAMAMFNHISNTITDATSKAGS
jgi:pilus assembly protein Flp/PilA